jgi:hypothetical protein
MMKRPACLTILLALLVSGQMQLPEIIKQLGYYGLGFCGATIDWVKESNQRARHALSVQAQNQADLRRATPTRRPTTPLPNPASVFTLQTSFPPAKVEQCGKFRLYYEDYLQANNDGFANTAFGLGLARRNTLCAVLTYVQTVYNFNQLPANEYIDLYIEWSYAALTNPAPFGTGFLARGAPYFGPNFGQPGFAGFYGGYMFDHLTSSTGADPESGHYDGHIEVNFDKVYSSSGSSFNVSYWDDYTNTTTACAWDLYSILLHEVTHVRGWLSLVEEDSTTNHYAQNSWNNSFMLYDKYFLYYGEAHTPGTFTGNKLVTISPPSVNANVNLNSDPLRSNKVWMNNMGMPLNHPAYSGDFPFPSTVPAVPSSPTSLLSHLNDNYNSFIRMSQYSPGFQPNYVMGPAIAREQLKREWTNFEMRALLTIGYQLDPIFSTWTSLSLGAVTNLNLLTVNIPPQRSIPTQVTDYVASGAIANVAWAETMPVTATIATNNNTTFPPNATSVIINVSSLGTDSNGDVVRILPNSLFNIRGTGRRVTGIGGNNHNRLSVNPSGTQVTYRPGPGFRGRAQFGFYLWDGKEKGSFCVATIDVVSVGSAFINSLAITHNKIMNGSFEDGTEVRQRVLNENIEHPGFEFYREGPFMSGDHLSDNQPSYNVNSNNLSFNGGEYVYQTWKECSHISGGVKGNYGRAEADFNANGYTYGAIPIRPLGNSVTNPNHRYHNLSGPWNFFELITPVTQCSYYRFEMDINFQRTGLTVGSNFNSVLDFVTNPGTNPLTATTLTSVSLSIPVTTISPNAWQHFSRDIPYCVPTATTFLNLSASQQGFPNNVPIIDNLALSEISPKPTLTASTSAAPASGGCCTTLSANGTNATCATTYTWQPGNLSGQNVTVCPNAATAYTVTVNDGCRTATSTISVSSAGSGSTTWPKHPPGTPREFFTTTARAPNDDLFAAGYFTNSVTISGFPTWTVPGVNRQLMVARFSDTCGTLWAVQLGNSLSSESVNDMVVDSSGNVYITGSIATTTTFGSFTLNGPAMYLLKLDGSNGNVLAAAASSVATSAEGFSLSIDVANNVYVGGQYRGSLSFGSLPAMSSIGASMDVFAVKYNNALVPQWRNSFGSSAHDFNGGIAYSSAGSLYVAGNMNRAFTIGGTMFANATTNTTDMFIGRFNPTTGAFVLGRMEGNGTDSCNVRDIAVDGSGNVYFTGGFKGTFGVATTPLNASTTDIFIGRWNPNLANSWAHSMGGGGIDEGRSISFDALGNAYFAGSFVGPAAFAGFTPALLTGANNMFAVQVSLAGTKFFAAQSTAGVSSWANNFSITTLPSGQSYVAGSFGGTITFGSSSMQTSTATDSIISRLSNTGSFY